MSDKLSYLATRVELLALWGLLFVVDALGLPELSVYADSKTIIDWVNDLATLEVLSLDHWCQRIKDIIKGFYSFLCKHIYQEHNRVADRLFKEGMDLDEGKLIAQECMESSMSEYVLNSVF